MSVNNANNEKNVRNITIYCSIYIRTYVCVYIDKNLYTFNVHIFQIFLGISDEDKLGKIVIKKLIF